MELRIVTACMTPRRFTTEVLDMVRWQNKVKARMQVTDVVKETLQCLQLTDFKHLNYSISLDSIIDSNANSQRALTRRAFLSYTL